MNHIWENSHLRQFLVWVLDMDHWWANMHLYTNFEYFAQYLGVWFQMLLGCLPSWKYHILCLTILLLVFLERRCMQVGWIKVNKFLRWYPYRGDFWKKFINTLKAEIKFTFYKQKIWLSMKCWGKKDYFLIWFVQVEIHL